MLINLNVGNLILFLVIGVAAGFVANSLAGRKNASLLSNLALGLAGAFIGGFVLPAFGIHAWGLAGNFLAATVGAFIILLISRVVSSRPYNRY